MTDLPAPTDEQLDILNSHDNVMIESLAGCGKTSTLIMLEASLPSPILFLAFNKKIAKDAETKVRSTTVVRTFNALGHRTWADTIGRQLKMNPRKASDLTRDYIKSQKDQSDLWREFSNITDAVDKSRALGYIPNSHGNHSRRIAQWEDVLQSLDCAPADFLREAVDTILVQSIRAAYQGEVDYNDQIYMPALFGGNFSKYPIIMVDEYQDLNPVNHLIIKRLMSKGSRLIGVGDPNQNIYGFRGAAPEGMTDAIKTYSMHTFPLSVSFRCPEAIVKGVHWHVPNMKWSQSGGTRIVALKPTLDDIKDHSVVLCRNNAPLYALAMRLLMSGRSVNLAGSDIGPKVVAQMKKLGDETMTQAQLENAIDAWRVEKLARGSKSANDTAECMKVFASHGETLGQALIYAEHLFKQDGSIELYTGHKAKGLEWERVYHLEPWLVRKDEPNLDYVISTRSSSEYIILGGRVQ